MSFLIYKLWVTKKGGGREWYEVWGRPGRTELWKVAKDNKSRRGLAFPRPGFSASAKSLIGFLFLTHFLFLTAAGCFAASFFRSFATDWKVSNVFGSSAHPWDRCTVVVINSYFFNCWCNILSYDILYNIFSIISMFAAMSWTFVRVWLIFNHKKTIFFSSSTFTQYVWQASYTQLSVLCNWIK